MDLLTEMARGFTNKLARSKLTGMQHLSSMFFPWQIFIRFVRGYGGVVTTISRGKKMQDAFRKIWHP